MPKTSALELNISIPIQVAPLDRLRNIYKQIVNKQTGYTGLLLIIDEFGSWQDRHPEGSSAYSEDESLLQTLAETLPKDEDLAVFTIVASQKPMPRKFQGSRFKEVDVLRTSGDETRTSREYEMVVAERVRKLKEDHSPEIEEHYDFYRRRFDFARGLSLEDFRSAFPVQPLCFDILRRITANLATARIGINVLWDVLGKETEKGPQLHPRVLGMRRLVTASDLMESANLTEALSSVSYVDAFKAYQQAIDRLQHLGMDSKAELPLAQAIVRTMFLWHVARAGQIPMNLKGMAEAVVADEGMFGNPEDSVLNVVALMDELPQVKYDKARKEFTFRAEVVTGRPASEILEQYKTRYTDRTFLEQQWRDYLTNNALSDGRQSALFHNLPPSTPSKAVSVYSGIEYSGEEIAVLGWSGHLGQHLAFDQHFRIVYLLRHATVTSEALTDDRIIVCIPPELSDQHREVLRQLLALDKMEEEYRPRQDDEALRVREFVRTRRSEYVTAVLNAQREAFHKGAIVTRGNLALDAATILGRPDRLNVLIESLFATIFKARPVGSFKGNRVMKMTTDVSNVFAGLWEPSPTGKVRDALDNFAVGLGLALVENPRRFEPSACRAFKTIRELYSEAQQKGQNLQVSSVYEALARVGVPARLASLYLLCFVRRAEEGVELMLRQGHRLRLSNGTPPQGDRITPSLVREIEWNNAWADGVGTFDVLAPKSGRVWNDCLRWTRKLNADLKTATEPADVEHQQALLINALNGLHQKAGDAEQGLANLQRQANGSIPTEVMESLQQVGSLCTEVSFEGLVDMAEDKYNSPDELAQAVSNVNRLYELAQSSGAIASAYNYLSSVPQGRLENELEVDRKALLGEFDLTVLARNSDLWPSIESRFQNWRARYQREYKKFHRDYQESVAKNEGRRAEADKRLRALEHLEQVPSLASERRASQLQGTLQALYGRLNKCGVGVNELNLEAQPQCNVCQVRYGEAPQDSIDSIISQIDRALDDLRKNFQGQAIRRLLESSTEPGVQEFRAALDVSDKGRLIELLQSPQSVQILQGVLEKGKIKVKRTPVMAKLAQEFPTVSSGQVDVVVKRFRALLDEAIQEAEQDSGPDTQVEVRLQ